MVLLVPFPRRYPQIAKRTARIRRNVPAPMEPQERSCLRGPPTRLIALRNPRPPLSGSQSPSKRSRIRMSDTVWKHLTTVRTSGTLPFHKGLWCQVQAKTLSVTDDMCSALRGWTIPAWGGQRDAVCGFGCYGPSDGSRIGRETGAPDPLKGCIPRCVEEMPRTDAVMLAVLFSKALQAHLKNTVDGVKTGFQVRGPD